MSSFRPEPFVDALLRQAAGPAVYARGAAYEADGRVAVVSTDGERTIARVLGSEAYRVTLVSRGGRAFGVCDCPAFEGAGFCKHLVAVALTVNRAAREGAPPRDRIGAIRRYLSAQDPDALVERLLRLALENPDLLDEIELDAGDAADDDDALSARYRAAIDEACDARGGVDWHGAGDFARGVEQIVARLANLLSAGRAPLVLGLLDHLFDEMEAAFEAVDDSEGEIGGVLARAGTLHRQACAAARPDPVVLAQVLFAREMAGSWTTFEGAAADYADVLGPAGLAEYRRLAEAAWGAGGAERSWTLKSILDGFAERAGDVEARVALRKDDLRQPYAYVEIAGILAGAGRVAEALTWLEEGRWTFEDRPDERLFTRAAELLAASGRPGEAETLLWAAFELWPGLDLYRRVRAVAPDGPACPERAVAILRARLAGTPRLQPWSVAGALLAIQMAEGLIDDAWATAEGHDVGETGLKALADASAGTHPARAVAAYQSLVEARLKAGGAGNYDAAMDLIRRCAAVRQAPGAQAAWLLDLAARHKAKRTFIARLQTLG